jgi:hypothetical protein
MSRDVELRSGYRNYRISAQQVELSQEQIYRWVESDAAWKAASENKRSIDAKSLTAWNAKLLRQQVQWLKIGRRLLKLRITSVQKVVPEKTLFTYLNHIFPEDQIANLSAWYERQIAAGKSDKRIQIELLKQILVLLWAGIQIRFDNLRLPKSGIKKVEK